MATKDSQRRFNEAVKSLTAKLQPEYERIKKLKDAVCSSEREAEILDARSKGFPASFKEQESVYSQVRAYNNKVEGIAMALTALSASYGIPSFVERRFKAKHYL